VLFPTPQLRASSASVAPSAHRLRASACCAWVNFGFRPMRCPRFCARLRPLAVRVRMRSRSTSAKPPRTAIIKRVVLVTVSAHGLASERNCAVASTIRLTIANRSNVLRVGHFLAENLGAPDALQLLKLAIEGLAHGADAGITETAVNPLIRRWQANFPKFLRPQCRLSHARQTIGLSSALAPKGRSPRQQPTARSGGYLPLAPGVSTVRYPIPQRTFKYVATVQSVTRRAKNRPVQRRRRRSASGPFRNAAHPRPVRYRRADRVNMRVRNDEVDIGSGQ
jgi:hypothetical protein